VGEAPGRPQDGGEGERARLRGQRPGRGARGRPGHRRRQGQGRDLQARRDRPPRPGERDGGRPPGGDRRLGKGRGRPRPADDGPARASALAHFVEGKSKKEKVKSPQGRRRLFLSTFSFCLFTWTTMTIRFKCPHCQKPLGVKDQLAGKKAKCPVCKKDIMI